MIRSGHESTPESPYSNVSLPSRHAPPLYPFAPAHSHQQVQLSRQFQSLPSKASQYPEVRGGKVFRGSWRQFQSSKAWHSDGLSHTSDTGPPHTSAFSRSGALALLSAHEHLQFLEGVGGGTERRPLAGPAASSSQEAPSRDQAHAYVQTLSRVPASMPVRLSGICSGAKSAPSSASPTAVVTGARVGRGHSSDRKGGAGSVWESAYDNTLEEEHETKSVVHVYAGDSDPTAEKAELKCYEGGGVGVNGGGMNGGGSAGNERGNGSRRCLNYFPDTQVRARAKVELMRFVILCTHA